MERLFPFYATRGVAAVVVVVLNALVLAAYAAAVTIAVKAFS